MSGPAPCGECVSLTTCPEPDCECAGCLNPHGRDVVGKDPRACGYFSTAHWWPTWPRGQVVGPFPGMMWAELDKGELRSEQP